MDRITAMRVFIRVVEAGSFTKAADSLQMPKATVTKLVQGLESYLQVKLLQRTTRKVTVTPDGAAYFESAVRLLGDLDEIDASIGDAQATPSGRLRIDIGSSAARLILIPALPRFCAKYPDIQISLGVSDRPVDLVGDSVDCAIRGGEVVDRTLVARRIASLAFSTCATPAYFKEFGTPMHPRDLNEGHRIVSYSSARTGRPIPLRFARGKEIIEIEGRGGMSVNESNAHLAAAVAGLGLIQVPVFMTHHHIKRGELVAVLRGWQPPPHPVYAVYPANRHLSNRLRVFIDWVAELFAKLELQ
jgi:DNA-binding transcriptional LysR family regulator